MQEYFQNEPSYHYDKYGYEEHPKQENYLESEYGNVSDQQNFGIDIFLMA